MADQYAVNHKKRFVTVPAKLTDVADQGGRMRMMYDKFTFTHVSASLAGSTTLSLGITGTPLAFLIAAASTGAGTRYMREGVSNITQAPVTITSETTVIATLAGAGQTSAVAFVEVRIYYTVD